MISYWFLLYLRFFARRQLAKNKRAIVIGVTGSSGKTSTRLALVKILKNRGIVKHSAHANSETGIPLNILGITMQSYTLLSWIKVLFLAPWQYFTYHENYDFYVVEMGIDAPYPPKNMDFLLSIIKPDMAVILGANLVHAAAFDHLVRDTSPARKRQKLLKLIAQEKMKLAHAIPPDGVVVINADDPNLKLYTSGVKARLIRVGHTKSVDYYVNRTSVSQHGFKLDWSYQNRSYTLSLLDIFGDEYAVTFLAAFAISHANGVSLERCQAGLLDYRAPAGRMRVFTGIKHTHLIDSSYNASPNTMLKALKTLDALSTRSHKVAVVGDMRELGLLTKTAHQDLAKQLIAHADSAVLFGPLMKQYVLPILLHQHFPVYHAPTMTELIQHLKQSLPPNSWILFKGSQNDIFLERAVEACLADPNDASRLCRRGTYWDRRRSRTP